MTDNIMAIWGLIPHFLEEHDPRTAQEQFNEKYTGGWLPFPGFDVKWVEPECPEPPIYHVPILRYEGDPPYPALSAMTFRDQLLFIFPFSWVLILDNPTAKVEDYRYEIARMD